MILKSNKMQDFEQFWQQVEQSSPSAMTQEQQWAIADLLNDMRLDDDTLRGIRIMIAQSPSEEEAHHLICWLYETMPNQVTHGSHLPSQFQTSKHVKNICGL